MEEPDADDLCPQPRFLPPLATQPLSPPIFASSVYRCRDPAQAAALLAGSEVGYVYSRDKHPNADILAEKCRELHAAEAAAICGSGMAALAGAALAALSHGDHAVVSNQLYGKTLSLFTIELARLGIETTVVDACDQRAVAGAFRPNTRLLLVETLTNPLVRVSDLAALAELAHSHRAFLLVDNTFASAVLCRPVTLGADLVVESLTKIVAGHSHVLLGLVCGTAEACRRLPAVTATWGFSASPFDCWLAWHGLSTLALRVEKACATAAAAAAILRDAPGVREVFYPGLCDHADHALAARQFGGRFGFMLSFTLVGGAAAAEAFIAGAPGIPFCPSLGDVSTTLSHPASTSHRTFTAEARSALGIDDGTIRLSVGIEPAESVCAHLAAGLRAAGE